MRVVIQRVRQASVTVAGTLLSEIGNGLLVLLGIGHEDDRSDIGYLVRKIAGCRIFGYNKSAEKTSVSAECANDETIES